MSISILLEFQDNQATINKVDPLEKERYKTILFLF